MKIYSFKFRTPFGTFCLRATSKGLYSLETGEPPAQREAGVGERKIPRRIHSLLEEAARKLSFYLRGRKVDFGRFPVDWTGLKTFERRVLVKLRKIPWGRVESYQFLAAKAGKPGAARAVGRILHLNRLPFIVPCHRIVPKKGGMGGFSRGVRWKKRLLKIETGRADTRSQSLPAGRQAFHWRRGEFDRVSGGVIISKKYPKTKRGSMWKPTASNAERK